MVRVLPVGAENVPPVKLALPLTETLAAGPVNVPPLTIRLPAILAASAIVTDPADTVKLLNVLLLLVSDLLLPFMANVPLLWLKVPIFVRSKLPDTVQVPEPMLNV